MLLKYTVSALSALMVPITVRGIMSYLRSKPDKVEKGTVRLPRFMLLIGIIGDLFCGMLTALSIVNNGGAFATICFLCIAMLGTALIMGRLNYLIVFDEKGFTYRNFLGIKRIYAYSDITRIGGSLTELKLYAGKHVVHVDQIAVGAQQFYSQLHRGCSKSVLKDSHPDVPKIDPFKGHVAFPDSIVFLYVLIYALVIGGCIICAVYMRPLTYRDLTYRQTAFSDYSVDGNDLILYAGQDEPYYKIVEYHKYCSNIDLVLNINRTIYWKVYEKEYSDEDQQPYYLIKSLSDRSGNVVLSLDSSSSHDRKEMLVVAALWGIPFLLWTAYVAGSIIVGRNPGKYSKKVLKLFFKPGRVFQETIIYKPRRHEKSSSAQ